MKCFKKLSVCLIIILIAAFIFPLFSERFESSAKAVGATAVPVIFSVTDAVNPGEQFSINGEYFGSSKENLTVKMAPLGSTADFNSAPVNLEIMQVDQNGQYIVCAFPFTETAGIYDLWVNNGFGTSAVYKLNGPRPLFISEKEVWAGQFIDISGRNFDGSEFGVGTIPVVRLGNSHQISGPDILEFNEFRIRFRVPASVPAGDHNVYVSTGGGWFAPLAERQTLTVVTAGEDPLNIGAAWVRHIDWSRVMTPAVSGSNTAAQNDSAIQSAINTAYTNRATGGGVIKLPAGTFKVSDIQLSSYAVIVGAGKNQTFLQYAGTNQGRFIKQHDDNSRNLTGYNGIADLTVVNPYANDSTRTSITPDYYVVMGNYDGFTSHDGNKSEGYFVKNVKIDCSMSPAAATSVNNNRGYGLTISGSRVVLDNVDIKGYGGHISVQNGKYARAENVKSQYAVAQTNFLNSYTFVINSEFHGRREYNNGTQVYYASDSGRSYNDQGMTFSKRYWTSMHGIMARDKSHYDNVEINGMGAYANDGEIIGIEVPGGNFGAGELASATATSVTLKSGMPIRYGNDTKTAFGVYRTNNRYTASL